jgi:SPP1 gp7 family putative phage head morphogenesis protein
MFIGRALFIPDLIGLTGSATAGGSFTLGKEQINIFTKHINRRRKSIEDLINKEIIWPIVAYNWGYVDKYPKFRFKPISNDDAIEGAKIWLEAVKGKVYQANDEEINYFRTLLKFPEGEVERPEPAVSPFGSGQPIEEKDKKELEPKKETKEPEEKEETEETEKKTFVKKNSLPETPGNYSKKVDFAAIEQTLDSALNSFMKGATPILNIMLEDLIEQIGNKKILQTGNASKIERLQISRLKDLRLLLFKSMKDVYNESEIEATQEIVKNKYAKKLPISSEKALELMDEELYQYIGDFKDILLKKTRVRIMAAIKDGENIAAISKFIDDDLRDQALVSLERFTRTKHTETMNRARLDVFEATGVVSAYQYSAIMDNVTTELCAGLHGEIFAAGNQPIPPLHFNCRSTLVPITRFEEYEVSAKIGDQQIDAFIEERKDPNFSTQ